jgi:hypothetical protein
MICDQKALRRSDFSENSLLQLTGKYFGEAGHCHEITGNFDCPFGVTAGFGRNCQIWDSAKVKGGGSLT